MKEFKDWFREGGLFEGGDCDGGPIWPSVSKCSHILSQHLFLIDIGHSVFSSGGWGQALLFSLKLFISSLNSYERAMKAIKKISKAAKAAQKVRLEYLDETQSLVSGASGNNTDDNDDLDEEYADEMSKNWEKISTKR